MATNENLIPIPGRLHSVASEGHVTGADEIYDDTKGKNQSAINADVDAAIGTDSTEGTIKGRIKTLENAIGSGGSVDTQIDNKINALDATKSQTAGADGLALSITETDGKIASISGSIAANTYDVYGTASTAKTEVIGGATSDGNTLKKLEDRTATLETAVGTGGSIDGRIDEATEDCAYIGENDGSAVIADFDPQTDTVWKKAQTLSNAEKSQVKTNLGLPQEIYSKTEVNELVSTPHQNYVTVATYSELPASGSTDTIYRISNYDGTQVEAGVYSEYAWSGSAYVFLAAKSSVGEVFDISEYHAGAKYADLAAALDSNNGGGVPQSLQKGGMSVKFVSNSDNKYVQYFLTKDEWSASEGDWEKSNLKEEVSQLSQNTDDSIFKLSNIGGEIYYEKLNSRFCYCPYVKENTSNKRLMSGIPLKEGVTHTIKVVLSHNSDGTRLWLSATGYNPSAMVMSAGTLTGTFTFTPPANFADGRIDIRLSGGSPTPTDAIVEISYPPKELSSYPVSGDNDAVKGDGIASAIKELIASTAQTYLDKVGIANGYMRYVGTTETTLMYLQFHEGIEYTITVKRENEDCGVVRCWIENDSWHPIPSGITLDSGTSISIKLTPQSNQLGKISLRCGSKVDTKVSVEVSYDILNEYEYIRRQEINRVYENALPYMVSSDYDLPYSGDQHSCLALVVSTDSHIDYYGANTPYSKKNVAEMVDFVNKSRIPLAAIVNCGDSVTTSGTRWTKPLGKERIAPFFEMGMQSKIPFLYTKGNHDCNDFLNLVDNVFDDADWQEIYFGEAETKYGIVRQLKQNGQKSTWYYYDIPEFKVRIVAVDVQDANKAIGEPDNPSMCLYTGSLCFYISNEQFNWIVNTALNFDNKSEKDWGVILISHQTTTWERDGVHYGSNVNPAKYNMVSDIPKFYDMLTAFNNQGTYQDTYMFDPDETGSTDISVNPFAFFNLSINADFTRYASLQKKPHIIASLLGHEHVDMNDVSGGINRIWTLNQMCSWRSSDVRVGRFPETNTQNAFDILIVDVVNRKIRTIRFGAGKNCYGKEGNRFLPNGLTY